MRPATVPGMTSWPWTVALLLFATAATAEVQPPRFEVTPFAGYRFGGTLSVENEPGAYDLADAAGFGVLVNWPHRSGTKWEILYSRQSTDAEFNGTTVNDAVVDVELQVLQIGGVYLFERDTVVPYLAATIGATHAEASSRGSESDTYWSASLGLGVLVSPNSRIGLRLEARANGTLLDSDTDLLCRTGPDLNVCAIRVDGDLMTQVEVFAGLVMRF